MDAKLLRKASKYPLLSFYIYLDLLVVSSLYIRKIVLLGIYLVLNKALYRVSIIFL